MYYIYWKDMKPYITTRKITDLKLLDASRDYIEACMIAKSHSIKGHEYDIDYISMIKKKDN